MKVAQLLHNPGAGDEDHSKKELKSILKENGYDCTYTSADKDADDLEFETDIDVLVIAGGDGTVRKVTKALLNERKARQFDIGLLPLGTANNISKTLGITDEPRQIIAGWKNATAKGYDVGMVNGGDYFFLESCGFGLFPALMKKMKLVEMPDDAIPEDKIAKALEVLYGMIPDFEAIELTIELPDHTITGRYIMAEIMNIRSIGPNLFLSPDSDPGDGNFDLVLVPEHQKTQLATWIQDKINGSDQDYTWQTISVRSLHIGWDGSPIHLDDEVKQPENPKMDISLKDDLLRFLVP